MYYRRLPLKKGYLILNTINYDKTLSIQNKLKWNQYMTDIYSIKNKYYLWSFLLLFIFKYI